MTRPVPDGKGGTFPSIRAACRALKTCNKTIDRHLAKYGHVGKFRPWWRPVTLDGVDYRSVNQCLKETGLSPGKMERRLRGMQ